jgi:hypothetical protein
LGISEGDEFRVNATTANDQTRPTASSDADGDFVIAWQSSAQDQAPGLGVYARRYNGAPAAAALGDEFRVNTATFSDQGAPAVAVNAEGDIVVTWQSFGQDGSGYGIYAQRYSANPARPNLTSIVAGDGTAQRSQVKKLTLSFDRPVTLAPGAATLELLNTGGSGANDGSNPTDASAALDVPTTPDSGRTWVYAFAASSAFVQKTTSGAPTGSLVDGIYKLSVDPAKVTANGVPMTTGGSLTFHRLFGDINGNKDVNNADFGQFRNTFLRSTGDAAYNPAFDFNNNGSVNNVDFGQFRNRYGRGFVY